VDLDRRSAGVAGASRASPHSLVQELLNRSNAHLWAYVSNGLRLRVLRDSAALARQAYLEFDLESMMQGEVYADFALLWLVCHQSRVESLAKTCEVSETSQVFASDCWLERWSRQAQERGTRALDQLRDGVEQAITALGRGFITHLPNRPLREGLRSGALDKQDYYRQVLRLVYRLLFLFVAEDRGLLLDPRSADQPHSTSEFQTERDALTPRQVYTHFYSTARLRQLAERRVGTHHTDLYHALRLVMSSLGGERGCPELGLPALGGFLFSPQALPDWTAARSPTTTCSTPSARWPSWTTAKLAGWWTTRTSAPRSWAACTSRCWNCTHR
jgi:hypothetical protein